MRLYLYKKIIKWNLFFIQIKKKANDVWKIGVKRDLKDYFLNKF